MKNLDEIIENIEFGLYLDDDLLEITYNILEDAENYNDFELEMAWRIENDYDGRLAWILSKNSYKDVDEFCKDIKKYLED